MHEVRLATWRFAYDTQQNDSDMPRSERRQEINVRPESGGYPKGDAVVVDNLTAILQKNSDMP